MALIGECHGWNLEKGGPIHAGREGSDSNWRWPVADRLRKARQEWERTRTPYQREVLGTFKSDQERARFLAQHAPTYPAGA